MERWRPAEEFSRKFFGPEKSSLEFFFSNDDAQRRPGADDGADDDLLPAGLDEVKPAAAELRIKCFAPELPVDILHLPAHHSAGLNGLCGEYPGAPLLIAAEGTKPGHAAGSA